MTGSAGPPQPRTPSPSRMVAILACRDVVASEAFYRRLGFTGGVGGADYRMLTDGEGGELHLRAAADELPAGGGNPMGVYLHVDDVDARVADVRELWIGGRAPEDKPWGMYEVAVSDPDGALVRIGRPTETKGRR